VSAVILDWALLLAQVLLASAMACATVRVVLGPRAQDRILGLDALYIGAMLLLITIGIGAGSALFLELALAVSLLGFVTTLALAKFLLRGEVIE
jgi:multicomponent K+:H+ antiporter subunit F